MPVSVFPADDLLIPGAIGTPAAARLCHARPWCHRRKNGPDQRQTRRAGGVERSPPRDLSVCVPVCVPPLFLRTNSNGLSFSSIGTACFTPGGRRGLRAGTKSGGSLDQTESMARWSQARRRTYEGGMHESHSRAAEGRCVHFCTIHSCFFCLRDNLICPRLKVVFASVEHPIVHYICGQSGSVEIDVRTSSNTTTVVPERAQ